jgi:hypothetical protein
MIDYKNWSFHELIQKAADTGLLDCIRSTQPQFSDLIEIEKAARLAVLDETPMADLITYVAAGTPQYLPGEEHLEPQCPK